MLWFQGWDKAPLIAQIVLKSWKYFNEQDWTIIPLSDHNLPFYITDYDSWRKNVHLKYGWAGLSDIVRIELLKKYGGVWVDSTVFCTKPLNDWLFENINANGFFAFDHPRKNTQISSWFLANIYLHNSYIINTLRVHVQKYWKSHKYIDKYWWLHAIFDELYVNDTVFRKHYDDVNIWSADGPHTIKHAKKGMLGIPMSKKVRKEIDLEIQPMFKLDKSMRWNSSASIVNSSVCYLLDKYAFAHSMN